MRNGQRFAYVSDATFRSAVAPGGQGLDALAKDSGTDIDHLGIRAAFTADVKMPMDDDPENPMRAVDIVISTDTPDRDRDIIAVEGWDLRSYRRNPVVLFAHDYASLPVARGENVRAEDGKLKATAKFVPADIYPFAETIYRMLAGGWMNAASVGFRPLEWNYNEDRHGVDFNRTELLEFSIVPVPANAECLVEARAAGVDVEPLKAWAEKTLEWLGHKALSEQVDLVALSAAVAKQLRDSAEPPRIDVAVADWLKHVRRSPDAIVASVRSDVEKRGRVLSASNERLLRAAGDAVDAAAAKIRDVVAQVEAAPEAEPVEEAAAASAEKSPLKDYGGWQTYGHTTTATGATAPEHVHDYSLWVYTDSAGATHFEGGRAFEVADHGHRITEASLRSGETEETDGHRHALMPSAKAVAEKALRDTDAIDLYAIPYGEPDALDGVTADDIITALRETVGAEAANGVRRALNGALGRVD